MLRSTSPHYLFKMQGYKTEQSHIIEQTKAHNIAVVGYGYASVSDLFLLLKRTLKLVLPT